MNASYVDLVPDTSTTVQAVMVALPGVDHPLPPAYVRTTTTLETSHGLLWSVCLNDGEPGVLHVHDNPTGAASFALAVNWAIHSALYFALCVGMCHGMPPKPDPFWPDEKLDWPRQ